MYAQLSYHIQSTHKCYVSIKILSQRTVKEIPLHLPETTTAALTAKSQVITAECFLEFLRMGLEGTKVADPRDTRAQNQYLKTLSRERAYSQEALKGVLQKLERITFH